VSDAIHENVPCLLHLLLETLTNPALLAIAFFETLGKSAEKSDSIGSNLYRVYRTFVTHTFC